jgi:Fe2+ or Zn2+ uptake regulation protein
MPMRDPLHPFGGLVAITLTFLFALCATPQLRTMNQENLFPDEERIPPHNYTDTSKAAAAKAMHKQPRQRDRVLKAVAESGDRGLTQDEASVQLDMLRSSVCSVFNQLEGKDKRRPDLHLIYGSDDRRDTRYGCPATVYKVLPR